MPSLDGKILEYGLMGAVLLSMLASFLWVFRVMFTRGLKHFDEIAAFMANTARVLTQLSEEQARQREVLDDISREWNIKPTTGRHR